MSLPDSPPPPELGLPRPIRLDDAGLPTDNQWTFRWDDTEAWIARWGTDYFASLDRIAADGTVVRDSGLSADCYFHDFESAALAWRRYLARQHDCEDY